MLKMLVTSSNFFYPLYPYIVTDRGTAASAFAVCPVPSSRSNKPTQVGIAVGAMLELVWYQRNGY